MIVEVRIESGTVRKIARSVEERRRLAGEALMLTYAAHPGVVRLVGTSGEDPPSEVVVTQVQGNKLSELARVLDWSEVAGLGAALATTVADLHDIGVVHRSVSAEHILLDEDGRPVLCGFGSAERCHDGRLLRAHAAEDVASLAMLLLRLGQGTPPRSIDRALRSATNRRKLARGLAARRMARALAESVPSARLPGSDLIQPSCVAGSTRWAPHLRKKHRRAVATVSVAAAAGLLLGVRVVGGGGQGAGCPAVDDGCSARAVEPGSVVSTPTGRFRLTGVTGLEVVGRWNCEATASPAVLDLARGDVWVFDRWPADPSGVSAQLVAELPGASGLRVVPGSEAGSRCDTLLVERRRLRPTLLNPGRT